MLCCEFLNIIAILQFFEYLKLRKRSLRPPKKHNHKEYKQIMYMYNNAILKGFSGIKIWKIILHVLVISIQVYTRSWYLCIYIKRPKSHVNFTIQRFYINEKINFCIYVLFGFIWLATMILFF